MLKQGAASLLGTPVQFVVIQLPPTKMYVVLIFSEVSVVLDIIFFCLPYLYNIQGGQNFRNTSRWGTSRCCFIDVSQLSLRA